MSNSSLSKYLRGVDPVDELVAQWEAVDADLDLDAMALVARMGRVHTHLSRAVEAVFAAHGLTTGEFDVLAALRRSGPTGTLPPSALARALMLSPAGMTNRIDRLAAAGLVERAADPDDRRSLLVVLTAKGKRLVDEVVGEHVANEASLLSVLSAAERKALDRALRRLLASFEG